MAGIGVIGRNLGKVVDMASSGSIGKFPPETNLEGLLGTEESILLDPLHREVHVNQDGRLREVHLTPTEFNLLEYLMRNAGRAVPYDEISREVLGYDLHDWYLYNDVRMHVSTLRKKIGDNPRNPIYIETVISVGYKFSGTHEHAVDDVPLGSEKSLLLYPSSRQIYVNDNGKQRKVYLYPTEFNLLEYLMRNAGRAVPHDEISREVFGPAKLDIGLLKNIGVYVSTLRKKIGDNPYHPIYIETVEGEGYRFMRAQNKG